MSRRYPPTLSRLRFSPLLLLLALWSCGKSNLDLPTGVLDRKLPNESSQQITITEFNRGEVDYVLKAARMERFYDRRVVNAYGVDILALNGGKDQETTTMQADSTIVDEARRLIFAHGRVKLVSPSGTLTTNRLTWDQNSDEIFAPDQVTLIREGNILRGRNLRTDLGVSSTAMDSVTAEGYFGEEYEAFLDW